MAQAVKAGPFQSCATPMQEQAVELLMPMMGLSNATASLKHREDSLARSWSCFYLEDHSTRQGYHHPGMDMWIDSVDCLSVEMH